MKKKLLTLRTYLALWIALILLFTGTGLIIAINSMASVLLSNIFIGEIVTPPIIDTPQINEIPFVKDDKVKVTEEDLGFKEGKGLTYDQAVQKALKSLRTISIVSLVVMLLFGSLGAYWLSKKILRPVQYLSQTVKRIHANNLTERIPTDGPDDEIKELACSFNTMLSQLEQHIRRQRRFISDAAHELRTPLSVLQINLEVLQDNPEATIDEYREALSVLNRQLDRLKQLINDLLAMSGSGMIEPREKVNLKVMIAEIIAGLEPVAEQYQVTLHQTADFDVYCIGKEALLSRAFSNIIENAVRYNRPGGKVSVVFDDRPDDILVTISDTGIGMAKEEQSHIFEPFYRIERSRSRHYGGAGLGLAITALIIEGHGGTISVESAPGEGSSFTITLPKNPRHFARTFPGDMSSTLVDSGKGAVIG
ncbi:sensor histidine kinase [Desulfoscipio geothermicus]|uniref:histidine kinase n=1 Tax=Desulfoscipio geothermicus DSM 3669 TaxID=1121426 RepID=A0A1I6EKD6_9FIRM|nr:HAMP domain-containing sensor histidine kinase [Desulfoscipio geothermicus]SFR18224.1 Signal transduction histidine kinase [Desulfoscipio geothermicus DSM 3669]